MERLALKSDIDFLHRMYMHPEVNRWLLYEHMDAASFTPVVEDLLARQALFIYEAEGKPAAMFKLMPQKFRNSHIMYLGGVAVDPEYRGKGIGRKMLERAIGICWARGFTRIELTVSVENQTAIKLYENLGFNCEGILKNYAYLASEGRYMDEQVMALLFTEAINA
jgi:putative acetyltransferase